MSDPRRRQERWLHARISEQLEGALKREAGRRRLPVSFLVRDVLEGALDVVEEIVEGGMEVARRSRDLARTASGHPRRARDPLADVYGWQELILNRAAACARCDAELAAGAKAYRGLRERASRPTFLCVGCVRALRTPSSGKSGEVEESA